MKNLRLTNKGAGWSSSALKTLLIIFLLVLAAGPVPAVDAPSSYDSLRLFTEALFEISQKYVHPKSEEDMIYGSLRGMMNSLDPDSSFLTPKEYQSSLNGKDVQPAEAGVEVIIKDNLITLTSIIDGSPAAAAGLRPGDHIFKINGQMVRNLTTQEVARRFRGSPGTTVKLQVLRNGAIKPLDISVTFAALGDNTVSHQVVHDSYAYLRVRYFNDTTPKELGIALKTLQNQNPGLRGLILDLRNNARGTMEQAVRTASILLGDKEIVSARGRTSSSQETFRGKERDVVMKMPLPTVVLVDQGTARASEIVAAALHEKYQATLLGAKTLGLCGLTKLMPLKDGSALIMTVAQCYTPGGHKIQGKGLEPQIQGQTPKDKDKEKAPAVEEAKKPLPPDQDPWVLQAVEVLKGGKKA